MKIHSFIRYGFDFLPVEVEVSLLPGLPKIQILGLPDNVIKESLTRIQSAILSEGFELPMAQRLVINLRPNHLRKSSRGLELAIAAAILWKTGQVPEPLTKKVYVYGELRLSGEAVAPDDLLDLLEMPEGEVLITGKGLRHPQFSVQQVSNLRELVEPQVVLPDVEAHVWHRPNFETLTFPKPLAELMAIVAVGEHPILFAGPAGSGKSTGAQHLPVLLNSPSTQRLMHCLRIARFFGIEQSWLPVVSPHHTISVQGMVGGGNPPMPGEVTRAHGGVLLLDELLEFSSIVQESLREPIESGRVTVARSGRTVIFPSHFLLVATTNLCPCGDYVPKQSNRCRCLLNRRRSYLHRLGGPLLDRFQILSFSHLWQSNERLTLEQIWQKVNLARRLQEQRQQKIANARLSSQTILNSMDQFTRERLLPDLSTESIRRQKAFLAVMRTIADLDGSEKIQAHHIKSSMRLTHHNFQDLRAIV